MNPEPTGSINKPPPVPRRRKSSTLCGVFVDHPQIRHRAASGWMGLPTEFEISIRGARVSKNEKFAMDNNKPCCLRVTLPVVSSNMPLQAILHLGLTLKIEVEKKGGSAKCFKIQDHVIVEMSGISRDPVERLIHSIGSSPSMRGSNLDLVIEERSAPEIDLEKKEVLPGEFMIQQLTKKFLLGLPDGAIIVGNEFRDGAPTFMVRLHEGQNRSRIWSRAVSKEAAQRICHVYWNADDVRAIHGVDPDSDWDDEDEDSDLDPFAR